jgi:hypothetical protein
MFRTCFATLLAVIVGGRGGIASAQDLPDRVRPARERIVERFIIGGSLDDDGRRRVSTWALGDQGWPQFVATQVADPYRWGVRRFWLHNPFGTVSGEVMQFDQYLDAREGRHDFLVDRFAESWRPIVKGSLGEPVELVCYLGAMDPNDDRMKRVFEEGDPAGILSTMLACIRPVLMAGGSIGADAATPLDDEGPAFHFYKFLESIGMPVYVESRPRKAEPRWSEFPVFALDSWWRRSNPELHFDSAWALPNNALTKERLRMVDDLGVGIEGMGLQSQIDRVRTMLLEGDTVVVNTKKFRERGVTLDDLTRGIDEEIERIMRRADASGSTEETPVERTEASAEPAAAEGKKAEDSKITVRKRGSSPVRRRLIGPGGD